ncbi:arginine deiminase family protein [Aquibacillus koreensis]|uniref:Arginine deiminase family protein n=1 Tax=Aquibacillus koreensis TaxID=279446 RepID=A0A9X3WL54_9BACI|nr:arginine deiminase family protein [Aquibacillus koreensis]MCT2534408.1 arginine deiminase family protein [Aquibacillus koreensis]MDC3421715.1 arginine deiminase family protein [Aquibacillus koreensis]
MELETEKGTQQVASYHEYDVLQKVIVCSPEYMRIGKVINETQKHYQDENIDEKRATEQHDQFVKAMQDNGIEVIAIKSQEELHEQVFTRDIGFCIGDQLFTAAMGSDIRAPEVDALQSVLKQHNFPFRPFTEKSIEGGDVIIDDDLVWVGISERTTYEAADALQALLPSHKVMYLPIAERILHLDCCFNVIGPKTALIYSPALTDDDLKKVSQYYDLIEVSKEEEFTLGTNVLCIGNKKIISLPENKQVNAELTRLGYQVIEVEFNEIIKSGGSFRCCSLPVLRTKE